jgi:hypothetical protein
LRFLSNTGKTRKRYNFCGEKGKNLALTNKLEVGSSISSHTQQSSLVYLRGDTVGKGKVIKQKEKE